MVDREWQEVIDAISARVPELVETFLAKVLADPAYSESRLTIDDLRKSGEASFSTMLRALGGGGPELEAVRALAADLGARRARQGVALDSLIRAIRLDFSVLWDAMSDPGLGADPALLVRHAKLVWQIVDAFASRVQEYYLAESEEVERADADLQHQYLTQLLALAEPTAADLARIAGALRVDVDDSFFVASIDRNDSLTVRRRLRARPPRDPAVFTYDQGHHTLVIRRRPHGIQGPPTFPELVLFEGMAVAVAPPADGVEGIRIAVTAAREIMKDLPMGATGVFTLRDRWMSITSHLLTQVGCSPASLVGPALDRCTPVERSRILETVECFLGNGSLLETSERLDVHRNTVVNRLAAFKKYTGLDLQQPRDAAMAILALQ
ncbi:helix-turn-helix domain-containing protein [Arthrobacter sp. NPDC056691]|uniref:helix-turn-helix domain-containing protein n=1 Tax=Arthrobacter sp. NPDC056691 TaxID=3345913 RepID=UPI00366BE3B3